MWEKLAIQKVESDLTKFLFNISKKYIYKSTPNKIE